MTINFTQFLTEASFSPQAVEKVLTILVRLIEKKIGQRLYRYAGANGFQEVEIKNHPGKGKGFLYFTTKQVAIRFNFVKGDFVSMNFWQHWEIGKASDMYIDFGGANIVRIANIIVDKLTSAVHGQIKKEVIPAYLPEQAIPEGAELITEQAAKRVTPEEFFQIMQSTYPNADYSEMHWRDIANAGAAAGVAGIPGFVKAQAVPNKKGYYSVIPPSAGSPGATAAVSAKPDPILYIKVTAQDPVSKKFLSAGESKQAQDMYNQIQNALSDNSANMAKKEIENPDTLFGALSNLVKLVIKGTNKALMIYGGPGTGKSFTVTSAIEQAGLVKNRDWYHVKGKITTQALYELLFIHRDDKIIVFDDADSVFNNEDSGNILKAALDSYDERIISWLSPRTQNIARLNDAQREAFNKEVDKRLAEDPLGEDEVEYDEDTGKSKVVKKKPLKYPSEFRYDGRIIFISNLGLKDIDSAVLTRSFKINMDLTDEQMFMRMESIIEHLGNPNLTKEEKLDTLRVLKERHLLGQLKNPQMRTFVAASNIRASGVPNWIELLKYS
jgi:hypothetical protein